MKRFIIYICAFCSFFMFWNAAEKSDSKPNEMMAMCEGLLVKHLAVKSLVVKFNQKQNRLYMPFTIDHEAKSYDADNAIMHRLSDLIIYWYGKIKDKDGGLLTPLQQTEIILKNCLVYAKKGYPSAMSFLRQIFEEGKLDLTPSPEIASAFHYAYIVRQKLEREPCDPEGFKPEELEVLKKKLIHEALEEALEEEEEMKKASTTQKKTRAKGGAVYHSISGGPTGKPPRRNWLQHLLGIGKPCSTPSHKKTV